MALTTNKINKIKAEWKTGKYSSAYALGKALKVSDKTVTKIIDGIPQSNAVIVDVCVKAENALNSVKNPIERRAVENLVKERTIADQIEDEVFGATLTNVKAARTELKEDNKELTLYDRKTGQELLDKALITAGKAARHSSSQVTVNTQTNVRNNTLELSEEEAKEKALSLGVPLSALL